MKDKEYHVTNFATFVSKTLVFFPQKLDEFNKIFELTTTWAISKWM